MTFKHLIGRPWCKHSYKEKYSCSTEHKLSGKKIMLDYRFECVKCKKIVTIKMDKDYQIGLIK